VRSDDFDKSTQAKPVNPSPVWSIHLETFLSDKFHFLAFFFSPIFLFLEAAPIFLFSTIKEESTPHSLFVSGGIYHHAQLGFFSLPLDAP